MLEETGSSTEKFVIKRNGSTQPLSKDKLKNRLEKLTFGLASKHIDIDIIVNKVADYSQNGKNLHQ